MERKDIRLSPDEEKEKVYEQIGNLYRQGNVVTAQEHKSGFPAITVDCQDIHILTDCLSLENWTAKTKWKEGGQSKNRKKGGEIETKS